MLALARAALGGADEDAQLSLLTEGLAEAVGAPLVEVLQSEALRQRRPDDPGAWARERAHGALAGAGIVPGPPEGLPAHSPFEGPADLAVSPPLAEQGVVASRAWDLSAGFSRRLLVVHRQEAFEPDLVEEITSLAELARQGLERRDADRWRLRELELLRKAIRSQDQSLVVLYTLLSNAPAALAFVDEEGRYVRVNEAYASLTGAPQRGHVGRTPSEVAPVVGSLLEDSMREVARSGRPLLNQEVRVQREGRSRHWLASHYPMVTRRRERIGVGSVAMDVTEVRRAEDRLGFLAEVSRRLAESIDLEVTLDTVARLCVPALADWSLFATLDEAGVPRWVSAAGASDPETVRRVADEYDIDLDAPRGVGRVLRTGDSELVPLAEEALSALFRLPEWAERASREGLLSYLAVPLLAHGATVGALVLTTTRASGRRLGEEDLALAEEVGQRAGLALENARLYRDSKLAVAERTEFISVASHELSSPLGSLKLQLQSLQKAAGGKLEVKLMRKVEASVRQVDRLARLISTLLDVSRIGAGQLQLDREVINLADLLQEVAERYRDEADSKGCALSMEGPPTLDACVDRLRLEQVLVNLLSNAVKYGSGQPVVLRYGEAGEDVWVEVEDHGIGIDAAMTNRIFDRYARAVTDTAYSGLGLGLYVSRQIVDAHGGRISVRSAPGQGSTFRIEVPRRGRGVEAPAS